MIKTVTHINCPEEWDSENDYDSHKPTLWLMYKNMPNAKVVEYGMGDGSTPILIKYFSGKLISIENNDSWINRFTKDYYSSVLEWMGGDKENKTTSCLSKNEVHLVLKTDDIIFSRQVDVNFMDKISVVFVDSAPGEERKNIVAKWANLSDIIILHDTEIGARGIYGISEILDSFMYRLDYCPTGKPGTSLLSNKINILQWV